MINIIILAHTGARHCFHCLVALTDLLFSSPQGQELSAVHVKIKEESSVREMEEGRECAEGQKEHL